MLVQPLASLTDLALGLVTLELFRRLPRDRDASRYWRAAFGWAAVTAIVGAAYHGVLVGRPRWGTVTWAVMSSMVVVVMSFILAASVIEVLGRSRAIVFWPLRLIGLIAYAVFAVTGHASITAILWCESVTVACVLGLWTWAWLHGHPLGRPMLVAIGVSIAAAMFRLIPGAAELLRLDKDSAYHLGQIAGMVLLFLAVARAGRPEPVTGGRRGSQELSSRAPAAEPAGRPVGRPTAGPATATPDAVGRAGPRRARSGRSWGPRRGPG